MDTLVAGGIGTGIGLVLRYVADRFGEGRRNVREDENWKRERYAAAAADLLTSSASVGAGTAAITRGVTSLMNAERIGKPETIAYYQKSLDDAWERLPAPTAAMNQATELIRLYAPSDVVDAAVKLRNKARESPEDHKATRGYQTDIDALGEALVTTIRSQVAMRQDSTTWWRRRVEEVRNRRRRRTLSPATSALPTPPEPTPLADPNHPQAAQDG